MKFNNLYKSLLEQNDDSMFTSRGSDRQHRFEQLAQQRVQEYLKKGHGELYLNNTNIKALPKKLKVGGWLYLRGTPIETLPKDLKANVLYLPDTPLAAKYTVKQLEKMVPNVVQVVK